jgi:hypothetical protein
MEVTIKTAQQLRLTEDEFELIKQKLGRIPNLQNYAHFPRCGASTAVTKIRLNG